MLIGVLGALGALILTVAALLVVRRWFQAAGSRMARIERALAKEDEKVSALKEASSAQQRDVERLRTQNAELAATVKDEAHQVTLEIRQVTLDVRHRIREAVGTLRAGAFDEPAVPAESIPLPPPEIRMGGKHFQDDQDFMDRADRDVKMLIERAGLSTGSRLLDWGCGAGRLAIGVRHVLGQVEDYHGVDVQARLIDWASEHLTDEHTRFTRVDLANDRYNPGGAAEHTIPADDDSVDVFHAYSVFSHMGAEESQDYLKEIARLLAPDGRAWVTCFVEEDVPDCVENPEDYGPLAWDGPLHCVRYNREAFERMIAEAGLAVRGFLYGQETDGQSYYVLRRR
jgi:SAM-dependent methyltransferase